MARSTPGAACRNACVCSGGAEAHHRFDAGPVVPAAVEDDHVAGAGRCGTYRWMYIWDRSRSFGAGRAMTRNTRGLTRSVIALMVPPLPAVSRPSKTMQTFAPVSSPTPAGRPVRRAGGAIRAGTALFFIRVPAPHRRLRWSWSSLMPWPCRSLRAYGARERRARPPAHPIARPVGARRARRIHLTVSTTIGSASASPRQASHCGPVSGWVSRLCCRKSTRVASTTNDHGDQGDRSGLEERRGQPGGRVAAVGQRVGRRAEAHHHERHGQRGARRGRCWARPGRDAAAPGRRRTAPRRRAARAPTAPRLVMVTLGSRGGRLHHLGIARVHRDDDRPRTRSRRRSR